MESHIRRHEIRYPRPSDKGLDFDTYSTVVQEVSRSLGIPTGKEPSAPIIRLMELDEDLPAYDESASMSGDKMPYIDKRATPLYLDPATQTWERIEGVQKQVVCNPYKNRDYYKTNRIPFLFLNQCGKFIPIALATPSFVAYGVTENRIVLTFAAQYVGWGNTSGGFEAQWIRPVSGWAYAVPFVGQPTHCRLLRPGTYHVDMRLRIESSYAKHTRIIDGSLVTRSGGTGAIWKVLGAGGGNNANAQAQWTPVVSPEYLDIFWSCIVDITVPPVDIGISTRLTYSGGIAVPPSEEVALSRTSMEIHLIRPV